MTIRSNPCKLCGSVYHTAAFCQKRPKKYPKPRPVKKVTRRPTVSRKKIVKDFDAIFSRYIRLRNAFELNGELVAKCVTCGDIKSWKQLQNGHYYSRGRYPTRWDEDNCHVQCVVCNLYRKGNYIKYTLFMIDTYGRDFVDELGMKSVNPAKISTVDLKGKIDEYTRKVKILLDK